MLKTQASHRLTRKRSSPLTLRSRRLPGWALPVIGGTLVAGLVIIWMTSALWFFNTVDFRGYH